MEQKPLQKDVAELLIGLQNTPRFRRLIILANIYGNKILEKRFLNIANKCAEYGVYLDTVRNGFVAIDKDTDIVVAGVFPSLADVENWLDD